MTKPKSKPKAAVRSTSRSTSKSRTRMRLAPSSSKTAMRPDTKHARIIAMLRTPVVQSAGCVDRLFVGGHIATAGVKKPSCTE